MNIRHLPFPGMIERLYQEHYARANRGGAEYSSHWHKYSGLCDVRIAGSGRIRTRGCGFGDMYYRKPWHRVMSALLISSYLRTLPDTEGIRELMRAARPVLRTMSASLSYDAFRQLCALSLIRKHVPSGADDAFDILIIGDGYGFLSSMIRTVYPRARVTLVDIGPILLFQALNLQAVFPRSSHGLVSEANGQDPDFLYCEAGHIDSLLTRSFDLFVNISSMQEMTVDMIGRYFSLIRKTARRDNLFYCCNRELKVLPGGERIAYGSYPWREDDTVILDENPLFYRYYYTHTFPFKRCFAPMRHRIVRMRSEYAHTTQF